MPAFESRLLYLVDILELDDLAQEAVLAVTSGDCRLQEDGSLSENLLWNRQQAMQELRRLRGEGEKSFFLIQDGKWQGETVSDFLCEESMQSIRNYYLQPQKDYICRVLRSLATFDGYELGEDISDDYLLSLFSAAWYHYLEHVDEQLRWNVQNGLPASIPNSDLWYVDLGNRIEIGSLEYVASEYCGYGLVFDYEDGIADDGDAHQHKFCAVLQEVLQNPEGFSIQGHEECYSAQEREFLRRLQQKVLANTKTPPQRV